MTILADHDTAKRAGRPAWAVLLPLLALTACDRGTQTSAAPLPQSEVSARVNSVKITPGQWQAVQQVLEARLDGLPIGTPPNAADTLIGRRTTLDHCVSAEEARNPGANLLSQDQGASCFFRSLSMDLGKITAEVHCNGGALNGNAVMAITGEYEADRYDLNIITNVSHMPNGMSARFVSNTKGRWVNAACQAGPS